MIRLSCATLSFDGFGNNDFVKTFEVAPQVGYKHIEFNCWYPGTILPSKMADLKRRCEKAGLLPSSIHVSSFGGDGYVGQTKDLCHKMRAIDAATELGCGMVSASGAGKGTQGGVEEIIDVLKDLAPYAEKKGVKIGLENHVANNLEDLHDYQRILDAIDSPSVGICMDTGHFDAAGVSLDELVDRFSERINHIHVKDNDGFGVKQFVRFAEGTTENNRIVQRMIDKGYSGYIVVEVSPEISKIDGRPFTIDDLVKPYDMFKIYEEE